RAPALLQALRGQRARRRRAARRGRAPVGHRGPRAHADGAAVPAGGAGARGGGGPWWATAGRARTPMAPLFLQAAQAYGLSANEDFNGASQDGVGWYQVTHRDGARASTAVCYLHPAMERPNLEVRTRSHVLNLLFDGTRVSGAAGIDGSGEQFEVRAEREVIVSCGAYDSPKLLMLSGVGRPE